MARAKPLIGLLILATLIGQSVPFPLPYGESVPKPAEEISNVVSIVLALAVLLIFVAVLFGCVCCRPGKGFQPNDEKGIEEFHNGPVTSSIEFVNPTVAGSELTIFPPPGAIATVSTLPLGSTTSHTLRPASFSSSEHPLTSHDWFLDPRLNFPRNQLQYLEDYGRGWFGRVVTGEAVNISPLENKTKVVVKILHEDATATDQMFFLHEVKPHRDLNHPNILRLLGRCLEMQPFLLLLEYYPNGDLKSFLQQSVAVSGAALSEQGVLLRMMRDVTAGLEFMHQHKLIHTDLAARNCVLTNNLTVKIGDYGNSIELFPADYYKAGCVALPVRWAAPETLRCTDLTIETRNVTAAANTWTLAVVLWEICEFGRLPYEELTDDQVIVHVLGERTRILPAFSKPCRFSDELYHVMKLCWNAPLQRPTVQQIAGILSNLVSCENPNDFERRWEHSKPNSIPKMDNTVGVGARVADSSQQTPIPAFTEHLKVATQSPRFRLGKAPAESLDDLGGEEVEEEVPLDSWLEGVELEDERFARNVSEAIRDLDMALAMEKSSSSSEQNSPGKPDFKLGPASYMMPSKPFELSSLQNTMEPQSLQFTSLMFESRGSEGVGEEEVGVRDAEEEELWAGRIERGEFTAKVKEKSRSIADLMVLTHIEPSDDSDDGDNLRSMKSNAFGSDSDIRRAVLDEDFHLNLKRLSDEHREYGRFDSINMIVPDEARRASLIKTLHFDNKVQFRASSSSSRNTDIPTHVPDFFSDSAPENVFRVNQLVDAKGTLDFSAELPGVPGEKLDKIEGLFMESVPGLSGVGNFTELPGVPGERSLKSNELLPKCVSGPQNVENFTELPGVLGEQPAKNNELLNKFISRPQDVENFTELPEVPDEKSLKSNELLAKCVSRPQEVENFTELPEVPGEKSLKSNELLAKCVSGPQEVENFTELPEVPGQTLTKLPEQESELPEGMVCAELPSVPCEEYEKVVDETIGLPKVENCAILPGVPDDTMQKTEEMSEKNVFRVLELYKSNELPGVPIDTCKVSGVEDKFEVSATVNTVSAVPGLELPGVQALTNEVPDVNRNCKSDNIENKGEDIEVTVKNEISQIIASTSSELPEIKELLQEFQPSRETKIALRAKTEVKVGEVQKELPEVTGVNEIIDKISSPESAVLTEEVKTPMKLSELQGVTGSFGEFRVPGVTEESLEIKTGVKVTEVPVEHPEVPKVTETPDEKDDEDDIILDYPKKKPQFLLKDDDDDDDDDNKRTVEFGPFEDAMLGAYQCVRTETTHTAPMTNLGDRESDSEGDNVIMRTPDDERSSDSGFREKGSLSESVEDADVRYNLDDIDSELKSSNQFDYEESQFYQETNRDDLSDIEGEIDLDTEYFQQAASGDLNSGWYLNPTTEGAMVPLDVDQAFVEALRNELANKLPVQCRSFEVDSDNRYVSSESSSLEPILEEGHQNTTPIAAAKNRKKNCVSLMESVKNIDTVTFINYLDFMVENEGRDDDVSEDILDVSEDDPSSSLVIGPAIRETDNFERDIRAALAESLLVQDLELDSPEHRASENEHAASKNIRDDSNQASDNTRPARKSAWGASENARGGGKIPHDDGQANVNGPLINENFGASENAQIEVLKRASENVPKSSDDFSGIGENRQGSSKSALTENQMASENVPISEGGIIGASESVRMSEEQQIGASENARDSGNVTSENAGGVGNGASENAGDSGNAHSDDVIIVDMATNEVTLVEGGKVGLGEVDEDEDEMTPSAESSMGEASTDLNSSPDLLSDFFITPDKTPLQSPRMTTVEEIVANAEAAEIMGALTLLNPQPATSEASGESGTFPALAATDQLLRESSLKLQPFEMATSFMDTADWDSASSDNDQSSSSSTEFIWKDGAHQSQVKVKQASFDLENSEDDDSDSSSESASVTDFVPSAWDSQAAPVRSALRTLRLEEQTDGKARKKRRVWFKKQKYHCIYEYPREPSEPEDAETPAHDNLSELYWGPPDGDTDLTGMAAFDGLAEDDGEFFVSSTARPFETKPGVGAIFTGSEFTPFWLNAAAAGNDSNSSSSDSGVDVKTNVGVGRAAREGLTLDFPTTNYNTNSGPLPYQTVPDSNE